MKNDRPLALDTQPLLTAGFVHRSVRLEQDGESEGEIPSEMEILLVESGKRRDASHGYWLERHTRFNGRDGAPSRERFAKLDEARDGLTTRVRVFLDTGWRVV